MNNYKGKKRKRGQTYWDYMREVFREIILHNIEKANKLQNNGHVTENQEYKKWFENLDTLKILEVQNKASEDKINGFIWVLNTCVFVVPEYNWGLIQ